MQVAILLNSNIFDSKSIMEHVAMKEKYFHEQFLKIKENELMDKKLQILKEQNKSTTLHNKKLKKEIKLINLWDIYRQKYDNRTKKISNKPIIKSHKRKLPVKYDIIKL